MKMVQSIFQNQRLLNIFDEYLSQQDPNTGMTYIQNVLHKLNNQSNEEFVVPVLGIQGTGKSSFLNALLMEELILPTDADETTCVPVEIRYGENPSIKVINEHDEHVVIEHHEELAQYVHNEHNPNNVKKIKAVQVFKKHELLKKGIVFVDLPGVGSLSPNNLKTTMDYVEKLSAAIFMLRTVPPITKKEANFLKAVWPKLSKAWFIQNQWNDESISEVEDGKEHNQRILEDIQALHGMNNSIKVDIVNVYAALKAALTNDNELKESSGMKVVELFFKQISNSWSELLSEERDRIQQQAFQDVLEELQQSKQRFSQNPQEHYEELKREKDHMEELFEQNERLLRRIRSEVTEERTNLNFFIQRAVQEGQEKFRTDLRKIVRANIVDGTLLAKAFQDIQQDITDDIFSQHLDLLTDIQKRINEQFGYLNVQTSKGEFTMFSTFQTNETFKAEKVLPTGLSLLGTGAGFLATALLSGTPAGWVVLGFMAGGSIIGGLLGKQAKKMVQSDRQGQVLNRLEEEVLVFSQNLEKELLAHSQTFFEAILKMAKFVKQEQDEQLEQAYEEEKRIRYMKIEEYKAALSKIEGDLAYVKEMEEIYHATAKRHAEAVSHY